MAISLSASIVDPTGTLPRVYRADPALTDGSLILIDFAHSQGYSPDDLTKVPANGEVIPNIARAIAADMIGGVAADMDLAWEFNASASQVIMERTAKGMLHGMVSQINLTATVAGNIAIPAAIRQHIFDHQDHGFYLSAWTVLTRTSANSATRLVNVGSSLTAANNYLGSMGNTSLFPAAGNSHLLGRRLSPDPVTVGEQSYRSMAALGFNGTPPASASGFARLLSFGRTAGFTSISNGFASWAIGRLALIDLTVAGKTWEEVDAIDRAMFDAAITVGGKFHGDSWSDPATALP